MNVMVVFGGSRLSKSCRDFLRIVSLTMVMMMFRGLFRGICGFFALDGVLVILGILVVIECEFHKLMARAEKGFGWREAWDA